MVVLFTKFLLGEKHQLSKVWLAAHWEKKLSKYHIYQINIESTVREMMSKEILLDLRLSGHLLVGIVRIFSRKTLYLLNECSSIFTKVHVFCPGLTDMPEHRMRLPVSSITLPDALGKFDDFDLGKMEEMLSSHQSRVEDITLKETYGNLCLLEDEFGDQCFNEVNHGNFEDDIDFMALLENERLDDNVCEQYGENVQNISSDEMDVDIINDADNTESHSKQFNGNGCSKKHEGIHISSSIELISVEEIIQFHTKKTELFLEPLPNTFKSINKGIKRKRKLIIDEVKIIVKDKIDRQFKDTRDITAPLDLAPPSKRLMILKEIGGVDGLFHLPGLRLGNNKILNLYKQNLKIDSSDGNVYESSSEESAYGSIEQHQLHSANFPDEFVEIGNHITHTDGVASSLSDEEINLTDAGVQFDFNESGSQPINFTNELKQEMSFSDGMETGSCVLQDKIVKMLKSVALMLTDDRSIMKFSVLVQNERRMKVSRKFSFLLMLKKFQIIELQQEETFKEIFISRGVNFIPAYSELCAE